MPQIEWRPGMATRCKSCGGTDLIYLEDGSAQCATCSTVTAPVRGLQGPPQAPLDRPPSSFVSQVPAGPSPSLAPSTTARLMAPSYPTPAASNRARARSDQRILGGIGLIVVGILISAVTYGLAASSPSGGTYFIAYGPVLFGAILLVSGLAERMRR